MQALPQPRRIPRQARSRALVEVILEATARVLAERGYAGTNTNLVAERAGVSVGSVYQYFPNKDSLITALHEQHAAQMQAAIEAVLAGAQPRGLRGHLAAIVHALLAAHQVAPALHRVLERSSRSSTRRPSRARPTRASSGACGNCWKSTAARSRRATSTWPPGPCCRPWSRWCTRPSSRPCRATAWRRSSRPSWTCSRAICAPRRGGVPNLRRCSCWRWPTGPRRPSSAGAARRSRARGR